MTDAKPYLFQFSLHPPPPPHPHTRPLVMVCSTAASSKHLLFIEYRRCLSCVHWHHSLTSKKKHGPDNNALFRSVLWAECVCFSSQRVLVSVLEVIDTSLYFLLWERKPTWNRDSYEDKLCLKVELTPRGAVMNSLIKTWVTVGLMDILLLFCAAIVIYCYWF